MYASSSFVSSGRWWRYLEFLWWQVYIAKLDSHLKTSYIELETVWGSLYPQLPSPLCTKNINIWIRNLKDIHQRKTLFSKIFKGSQLGKKSTTLVRFQPTFPTLRCLNIVHWTYESDHWQIPAMKSNELLMYISTKITHSHLNSHILLGIVTLFER